MAKNFPYQFGIDKCVITGNNIGSILCAYECPHSKHNTSDLGRDTISCPKIIRRSQITGKVIMRKK